MVADSGRIRRAREGGESLRSKDGFGEVEVAFAAPFTAGFRGGWYNGGAWGLDVEMDGDG